MIAGNIKDGLNWERNEKSQRVVGVNVCLGGNFKWSCALILYFMFFCFFFCYKAGKKTTDEELEEMLESGNPAIFTSGVSDRGTMDREGHGGASLQLQLCRGGSLCGV